MVLKGNNASMKTLKLTIAAALISGAAYGQDAVQVELMREQVRIEQGDIPRTAAPARAAAYSDNHRA